MAVVQPNDGEAERAPLADSIRDTNASTHNKNANQLAFADPNEQSQPISERGPDARAHYKSTDTLAFAQPKRLSFTKTNPQPFGVPFY